MKLAALALLATLSGAPVREPVKVAALEGPALPANVQVMAWPGGIGIPPVIGWAGVAGANGISWGSTAAITAANAYVTYDASNVIINAPTGKGLIFKVNGSSMVTIDSTGQASFISSASFTVTKSGGVVTLNAPVDNLTVTNAGTAFILQGATGTTWTFRSSVPTTIAKIIDTAGGQFIIGNSGGTATLAWVSTSGANPQIFNQGTGGLTFQSNQADGASALPFIFNNATTLANAAAQIASFKNNGTVEVVIGLGGASIVSSDVIAPLTAAGNLTVKDSAGNTLGTMVDNGTTGVWRTDIFQGQTSADTFAVGSGGNLFTLTHSGNSGSTKISAGTAAGNQVLITDTAGVVVMAVGTLGDGTNGIRGSTSQDLRIQSGDTKDLYLASPNGQVIIFGGHTAGGVFGEVFRVDFANSRITMKAGFNVQSSGYITRTDGDTLAFADPSGNTLFSVLDNGTTGTMIILGAAPLAAGNVRPISSGDSFFVDDASGNVIATFFDDGTTGSLKLSGTKSRGTITLSGGTGTATVNSGAVCTCTDTTATNVVKCTVATTTLTATGTTTDVIAYLCL